MIGDLLYCLNCSIAHARCILDEAGRIVQIDQLLNRQFLRTLAQYQYDDHGDLVRATDENGASRDYSYHRHLVTRYTDRTGRGMNLRWQDADAPDNANARAVSEWADDGSFAISLAWDPNIRMTLITDALQQVTRHYNDILGYTYRIVHPDGRNEWFYRDDAKNVVQHIHPDGTADRYVWDAKSRLRQHIRADGQSVYFDHDEMDNVITIVDPDRYHWKRDYNTDSQLVEETDPLGHKTEYTYNKAGVPSTLSAHLPHSLQAPFFAKQGFKTQPTTRLHPNSGNFLLLNSHNFSALSASNTPNSLRCVDTRFRRDKRHTKDPASAESNTPATAHKAPAHKPLLWQASAECPQAANP